MTEYIIQLEGRNSGFPTAIIIIEKEMYKRDIGGPIIGNPNLKIVNKYPARLEKNLEKLLGAPVMICPESKVFTIGKAYEKCVLRMFQSI